MTEMHWMRRTFDSGTPGRSPRGVLDQVVAASREALDRLCATADFEQLEEAARLLAAARAIHLIGHRRSFAVAAWLADALAALDVRVHLVRGIGGTTLQETALVMEGDVVVAVSLAPYYQETLAAAAAIRGRGIPIVALTDSGQSPLAALARPILAADDTPIAGFPPLAATMGLALAMLVLLRQRLDEGGPERGEASRRGVS